jgi:opacity protein-like surface antigen
MKQVKYTVLLSMLALLFSVSAFAADKNQRSVTISDPVQVGNTQLKPGDYKVEWQGAGSEVQVNFLRNGKTVATVPGNFKANDPNVIQDDVVTDTTGANTKTLKEIDFSRDKESLVFDQSGM